MPSKATRSGDRQIGLFLDMLAAERGARPNTLSAYRSDLDDFSDYAASNGSSLSDATSDDIRGYLGELARRGLQPASVARKLSAVRQLYRFLYAERYRVRRSGRDPGGSEARAGAAQDPVDDRGRSPDRYGAGARGRRGTFRRRASASGPAALPAGIAVRDRAARVGTGRAACVRRAPGPAHADGARKGREGAHGSAQRRGPPSR